MASGDRQRTWFPEMVELLRTEWRPDLTWKELIALRDRVDAMMKEIRTSRDLQPVVSKTPCPKCGRPLVQGGGHVSVRAMILAVKRFEIAPQDEVKAVEKRWNRHRWQTGLDLYGRLPSEKEASAAAAEAQCR